MINSRFLCDFNKKQKEKRKEEEAIGNKNKHTHTNTRASENFLHVTLKKVH